MFPEGIKKWGSIIQSPIPFPASLLGSSEQSEIRPLILLLVLSLLILINWEDKFYSFCLTKQKINIHIHLIICGYDF
jgi:hypothetical protein